MSRRSAADTAPLMAARRGSVHDLAVDGVVEAFEVRNLQIAHGVDRHREYLVGPTAPSDGLSRCPQRAKDLRTIKPLTFTMLAEAHDVLGS
jgi:hypothetical protein